MMSFVVPLGIIFHAVGVTVRQSMGLPLSFVTTRNVTRVFLQAFLSECPIYSFIYMFFPPLISNRLSLQIPHED